MAAKVISESFRPPGGSLINLIAIMAAHKHNTELQPCSMQSNIIRAKGTQGSSEDATLLKEFMYICAFHPIHVFTAIGGNHPSQFDKPPPLFYKKGIITGLASRNKHTHIHTQNSVFISNKKHSFRDIIVKVLALYL